ncbi:MULTISPECIES: hypothetical protein [Mycetocola]|uniref:hypothetical protein n=1 Tax=Mycetocola TaxID=76634 RepID=UPI0004C1CA09|nr:MULTISPECIES: hypothetical protein [Mycetocola]
MYGSGNGGLIGGGGLLGGGLIGGGGLLSSTGASVTGAVVLLVTLLASGALMLRARRVNESRERNSHV